MPDSKDKKMTWTQTTFKKLIAHRRRRINDEVVKIQGFITEACIVRSGSKQRKSPAEWEELWEDSLGISLHRERRERLLVLIVVRRDAGKVTQAAVIPSSEPNGTVINAHRLHSNLLLT